MSGALLYLRGSGYNQLARMATPGTAGSTLSGYTLADIYNGLADAPHIWDGTAGLNYADFDLNQITNGDFETAFVGGLPAAAVAGKTWGKSAGATLSRDTSFFASGVASLKVVGADQYAWLDLVVSAGEALSVTCAAMAAPSTVPLALMGCQNVETGMWLNPLGQWQAAQTYWGSGPSSFDKSTVAFTVEDFAACKVDRPTLRFRFVNASPATEAYFDDFYVTPRIDFGFIHNHNFPASCIVGLRSGTVPGTTFLRGTFTHAQPTMFLTMAGVNERYWRFISTAPPDDRQLYVWQFVLGQYRTSIRKQLNGGVTGGDEVQDRSGGVGPIQAFLRTAHERRQVELQFEFYEAADFAEHNEIMQRSRNGAYPLIVVVDSDDPSSAVMCQAEASRKTTQTVATLHEASLKLEEFPFRVVTP